MGVFLLDVIIQKRMDTLAGLNSAQKQAVETIEGPLLVLAGPGSGKTRVITHRVAYLVEDCDVDPRQIMAVTFTNKAAQEMKERLERLIGQACEALTAGTFHAICARVLRQQGKATGLDSRFVIYDEEDQLNLVKQILQELNIDHKQYSPRVLHSAISAAKSRLIDPEHYAGQVNSYFEEIVQRVYQRYQQLLAQSRAVDFDDLLMKAVQLFDKHPQVLNRYQSRYVYILVDEFQDTNIAQYALVKQLSGKYHNICVVGDPDQSIYSWRFADLRNILNFEKDYPQAKVVLLEQNYRSTKTILEVASDVISANSQHKPKGLWTENEDGPRVSLIENYSGEEEAQCVVNEIEKLISQDDLVFKDCAVMYRVNAQSREFEESFVRYGVPYKLVGGTRFYQRQEIKDIIAYIRLIQDVQDDVSLIRVINVPKRGIGHNTLAKLQDWARVHEVSLYEAVKVLVKGKAFSSHIVQALAAFLTCVDNLNNKSCQLSPVSLLEEILERTGYREYILGQEDGEERWENIMELKSVAGEYGGLEPGEALTTFLENVSLVADIDELDEVANAVTLITLHQAKGLEFPVVFIVGMEEGVLPHRKSFDSPQEMEEERRLCYVGITRAQSRLYLLYSRYRNMFGSNTTTQCSRFLQDISPRLITMSEPAKKGLSTVSRVPQTSSYRSGSSLDLKVGDHVRHRNFGCGVVMNCLFNRGDQEITVAFEEAGVKRLLLSMTPLEKL